MRMTETDLKKVTSRVKRTHLSSPRVTFSNALLNHDRLKFIRPRPTDSTGSTINAES